jgi:hypothetical protein
MGAGSDAWAESWFEFSELGRAEFDKTLMCPDPPSFGGVVRGQCYVEGAGIVIAEILTGSASAARIKPASRAERAAQLCGEAGPAPCRLGHQPPERLLAEPHLTGRRQHARRDPPGPDLTRVVNQDVRAALP